jgi:hypothetical protein
VSEPVRPAEVTPRRTAREKKGLSLCALVSTSRAIWRRSPEGACWRYSLKGVKAAYLFYGIFQVKEPLDVPVPVVFRSHRLKQSLVECHGGRLNSYHGSHQRACRCSL